MIDLTMTLLGDVAAANAEIERLRAELAAERGRNAAPSEYDLALLAERDALRALLREARQTLSYPASMLTRDNMCARIDALLSKGGGNDTSK